MFHPRERGVLDAAIALARKTGARSCSAASQSLGSCRPRRSAIGPAEVPEYSSENARAHCERLVATVPAELRGGSRTHVGTPWQSITEVAVEEAWTLRILIAAHGYSGMDGTTAAKVVNHADRCGPRPCALRNESCEPRRDTQRRTLDQDRDRRRSLDSSFWVGFAVWGISTGPGSAAR